jgi:hypothetical protein
MSVSGKVPDFSGKPIGKKLRYRWSVFNAMDSVHGIAYSKTGLQIKCRGGGGPEC